MTFHSMLKAQGFKRMKSYAKGTTCMISEDGLTAVDIYTETYGKWAWARGRVSPTHQATPAGWPTMSRSVCLSN
jgi:hypothetical protein